MTSLSIIVAVLAFLTQNKAIINCSRRWLILLCDIFSFSTCIVFDDHLLYLRLSLLFSILDHLANFTHFNYYSHLTMMFCNKPSSKTVTAVDDPKTGEGWESLTCLNRGSKKSNGFFGIGSILPLTSSMSPNKNKLSIGQPENFRQVSQILDVDILPETCRRVRLVKHGSDKPLGFYIRDGNSVRVTPQGLVKNHGIFISKLVAGGLAEGTGLLAQNDEVLEVNGIDVAGKTLDQVTDMMVANASNLIITIRPAAQRSLPLQFPHHLPAGSTAGFSNPNFPSSSNAKPGLRSSGGSKDSRNSIHSSTNSDDEEDEIRDHLSPPSVPPPPPPEPSISVKNNNNHSHVNHHHHSQQHSTPSNNSRHRHQQPNHPSTHNNQRHGDSSSKHLPQASTSGHESRSNGVEKRVPIESMDDDEDLDDSRFEEVVTL